MYQNRYAKQAKMKWHLYKYHEKEVCTDNILFNHVIIFSVSRLQSQELRECYIPEPYLKMGFIQPKNDQRNLAQTLQVSKE